MLGEKQLFVACMLAAVAGLALLVALTVFYGPPSVFAFQLADYDGRIVRTSGVVSSVQSFPFKAVVCDSTCFEAVASSDNRPFENITIGSSVVVTGSVSSAYPHVKIILGSRDSLRLVK